VPEKSPPSPFSQEAEPSMEQSGGGAIWSSLDTMPSLSPIHGVTMSPLTGERLMMNFVRLEPGAVVPIHHHPHEQAGTVLEGTITLTVADETRHLTYGDAYLIPPNVPHGATTDERGCLVIDVFSPPREDYRTDNR
jgi:quercetin dioxygenase-like cupin family protein